MGPIRGSICARKGESAAVFPQLFAFWSFQPLRCAVIRSGSEAQEDAHGDGIQVSVINYGGVSKRDLFSCNMQELETSSILKDRNPGSDSTYCLNTCRTNQLAMRMLFSANEVTDVL